MPTATHQMIPERFGLGPLRPLLEAFARFLGQGNDRHADDAFDDRDFDDAEPETEDRSRVRRFLKSFSGQPVIFLDAADDPMFDGSDIAEAASQPRGMTELLVTQALADLSRRGGSLARPVAPTARARPSELPAASAPTPSPTQEIAMRHESVTEAETLASDRLADEAKQQNDVYYGVRDRLDSASTIPISARSSAVDEATETPRQYAKRLNDSFYGQRRPAEPPAAPAPAGMGYLPMVDQTPPTPSAEEEAAFLAGLAKARGSNRAAADAIRSACEALPVRAASLASTFRNAWLGHVGPLGEPMARLAAMARALEAAGDGAIRYAPPTPEEVRTAVLRLITGGALANRIAPVKLLADVGAGTASLAAAEARVEAEQDRHLRGVGSAAGDLESLRQRYHHARAPLAGMGGVKDAFLELQVILPRALARAVLRAVEAAGGKASVVADLADLFLIQGTTSSPDPDEEELAAVQGQLKAIGSSTGRAATALVARRDELATALEGRRTAARETATSRAERDVSSALAGDAEAVQALAETVADRPDAFAEGLAKALAEVPRRALDEVNPAGLAATTL